MSVMRSPAGFDVVDHSSSGSYNPSGGTQQEACAELIEEVFSACFDFLYDDGRTYPKERTISIMGETVAAYLDERLSVSDRRRWAACRSGGQGPSSCAITS